MSTVTYSVPNISCHHCIHTIQSEISELIGITSVNADLDTKTVKIAFEPPASEDSIKSLMAEINYPVAA